MKQLNNFYVPHRSIYLGVGAGFSMAACDLGIIKAAVAEPPKSQQSFVLNYIAPSAVLLGSFS